jgi:superkiller protein 3
MEKIREGLNITLAEHLELESEGYMNLARTEFEKVHHQEAMELYDLAIENNPKNELAWMNKGFHLQSLGRFEEGVKCFDEALELNPGNAHALTVRGCALDQLKKPKEAVDSFKKALEMKAGDEWVWYNLGLAYYHMGENEEALKAFRKALQIKPEFTGPQKYIEMIEES